MTSILCIYIFNSINTIGYVCILGDSSFTPLAATRFSVETFINFFLPRTSFVLDHYLYLDFWWNFALSAACFFLLSTHGNKAQNEWKKKVWNVDGPSKRQAGYELHVVPLRQSGWRLPSWVSHLCSWVILRRNESSTYLAVSVHSLTQCVNLD